MANVSDQNPPPQGPFALTEAQRRLHGLDRRTALPIPPDQTALWAEASKEFIRLIDRRRGRTTIYEYLNLLAIDVDNLPLVLSRLGFTKVVAVYTPEERADFPDPEWEVMAMQITPERPSVWIDIGSGRWRLADATQRGPHMISLGEFMWRVAHREAAKRIALACGLREVPRHGI